MATQVDTTQLTHADAVKLVQLLIRKGTDYFIIRDTLMVHGYSAYAANNIIREVRQDGLPQPQFRVRPHAMQVGLLIVTVVILATMILLLIMTR